MNTLTREKHVAGVPDRWRMTYGCGQWLNHKNKQDIQDRLDAAIPSKETYDKIIGNESWTRLECDSCLEDVEIVVFINARASSEYGKTAICKKCLKKYLKIINQDARSGTKKTGEHLTTAPARH